MSHLIGVLECPAVDTVEGSVETALWEPDDIAGLEATSAHGVKGTIPVKGLPGHLWEQETR